METTGSMTNLSIRVHTLGKPQNEPVNWEVENICRSQRGDLDAFNNLILAYQDIVFRQALWILKDEASAEDACQEAFLRAFSKIHTFRGGPFRPWILKIATNLCLDQIRSTCHRHTVPLYQIDEEGEEFEPQWIKDPGETPPQVVERAETGQSIADGIHRLAPEYRAVIILVDLQEMNYIETSSILGIPIGTVKSRLARARRQLRAALGEV